MEPPGLKRGPFLHGEKCLSCKSMVWRDSKPHCAKSDYPVMHWYFCDDWEANPGFEPVKPPSERTVRYINRKHGEPDDVREA